MPADRQLRCASRLPEPDRNPLGRRVPCAPSVGKSIGGKPIAPVALQHGAARLFRLLSRPVGNYSDGPAVMSMTRMPVLFAALLAAGAALAPPGLAQENNRFLIYFDEFSANLTAQARGVIADAAQKAREG